MKTRKWKRVICWLLDHVDVRHRAEDKPLPRKIEQRMRGAEAVAEMLALEGSQMKRKARYVWRCQRCGRVNPIGLEVWLEGKRLEGEREALVQTVEVMEGGKK